MVGALIALRKDPERRNLVLSGEASVHKSEIGNKGKRLKLGLLNADNEKYADDTEAAKVCHERIKTAVFNSGYKVAEPREFDPAGGLNGLKSWAALVQYKRRLPLWPLLLLLPLLFFLMPDSSLFLGTKLKTRSFILIIDHSGSMESTLEHARAELKAFLATLNSKNTFMGNYHVDVIAFAGAPTSLLGGIEKLNEETAERLNTALDNLGMGGGTNLQGAIELAAKEIKEHGKPTTLVVVTDAEDGSIPNMLGRITEVEGWFGGEEVYINATTPRVLQGGDPAPTPGNEANLAALTEHFGGQFGTTRREQ
jgi:hypothetical protein